MSDTAGSGSRSDVDQRPERREALSPEEVVAGLRDAFEVERAVGAEVGRQTKARLSGGAEVSRKSAQAFARFNPSTTDEVTRSATTYLREGDDLEQSQAAVAEADIAAARTAAAKVGAAIALTEEELASVGLERTASGGVAGDLDVEAASSLLATRLRYVGTVDVRDFVAECRATLLAEQEIDAATHPPGAPGAAPAATEAPGATSVPQPASSDGNRLSHLVDTGILRQMSPATAPEEQVAYGLSRQRATSKDVQTATASFALRGGPADVTAFHDFHDLQIAFRHVWTELFDEDLAVLGRELYEELVELKGRGWESDTFKGDGTDEFTTADELRQLHRELLRARAAVAANDTKYIAVRMLVTDLSTELWAAMDAATQDALYSLVPDWLKGIPGSQVNLFALPAQLKQAATTAAAIVNAEKAKQLAKPTKRQRVVAFLDELEEHLREKHAFPVFAASSVNFGILVTYRQRWTPLSYQVGDLVATMPLAPKEVRRYATKRIVRKSRAVKEIENALQVRKRESQDTSRDHTEIVTRASNQTNFKHNAEGGVNFLVWNAKGSHSLSTDSAHQSASTKKEFREAVLRAAEEYRSEHRLEIDSVAAEEIETTTSGEISNPNDEIPVTYLFYELQRRYEICEKIQRVTPVVLVAAKVPKPHEIDEDWLVTNDWILRRAILDDSFLPALDYLSQSFVGEEIAVDVLRNAFETQLAVVRDVSEQVTSHAKGLSFARTTLDAALDKYAQSLTEESGGLFGGIADFLFGGDTEDTETLRVRMDAAKEAFQRAERQEQELRSRLGSEVTALHEATSKYVAALTKQFNRRTEILRLRAHVKDNILYYMQAIWDAEPPDQRFLRIHDLKVPDLQGFEIEPTEVAGWVVPAGGQLTPVNLLIHPITSQAKRTLVELADLDNLLGYKGNYMIFPLKQTNSVTTFMMQDYLDLRDGAAIVDPDEDARLSVDELLDLLRCLQQRFPGAPVEAAKAKYRDLIVKRLTSPYRDNEVIVVPSGSLYIEALPGVHPILEDFKLIHRAVDVKKAQAGVRHGELENIRLAARVLGGELEDADIDKRILIDTVPAGVDVDIE